MGNTHRKKKNTTYFKTHVCSLPNTRKRYLPELPPFASCFSKLRRSFLKRCLLSEDHPSRPEYFVSQAQIFKERQRQANDPRYKTIVHPLSDLAWLRDRVMCFIWIMSLFFDPYYGTFVAPTMYRSSGYGGPSSSATVGYRAQLVLNGIMAVDIIYNFFVGYVVDRTKTIVLDRKKIARKYVTTFFFFDFLALVSVSRRTIFLNVSHQIRLVIYQTHHLRCVRALSTAKYLRIWMKWYDVKDSTVSITIFTFVMILILHLWTCLLFLVPQVLYYTRLPYTKTWAFKAQVPIGMRKGKEQAEQYLQSAVVTLCHFYGAGVSQTSTDSSYEMLVLSMITLSGGFIYLYIIAETLHLFSVLNVSGIKYEELLNQLNEYMTLKRTTPRLKDRVLMYCDYKFQKKFFHEKHILNSLSEHLRFEVKFFNCRNLMEHTRIFRRISREAVGSILGFLQSKIYLPEDEIVGDDTEDFIHFISYGTIMSLCPNARGVLVEVAHLEDGQHFGYVKLFYKDAGEKISTTMVALEITEVFSMSFNDLKYCMDLHPDVASNVHRHTEVASEMYRKIQMTHEDQRHRRDILTELRSSRILEKGKLTEKLMI